MKRLQWYCAFQGWDEIGINVVGVDGVSDDGEDDDGNPLIADCGRGRIWSEGTRW